MSIKAFLAFVSGGSLLAWFSWFLVLKNTDPAVSADAQALFYSTLVLALLGTFTVLGLGLRRLLIKDDAALLKHLKQSLRQALLFTLGILFGLVLLAHDLFSWWIGLIILAVIIFYEAVFYSKRTAQSGYV